MSRKTTRRRFLQTSAALGAGYWIADRAAADSRSPNERVAFACIGTEGKGRSDSDDGGRLGDVVAICDVDAGYRAAAMRRFPKAKAFADFRKMFDADAQEHRCRDRQPCRTISTRRPAAMAMRHGIHCFVQKPLTHSLYEARTLAKLAREKKLATQMGNQGSAESGLRKAAHLRGRAGRGERSPYFHRPADLAARHRPPRAVAAAGVSRLGPLAWPAPARPYGELTDEQRGKYPETPYHPFAWRGWWDFGTGALGDIACHADEHDVPRPGPPQSGNDPGRDFRPKPRQLPGVVDHHLPVPGDRRAAGGEALLVRWRQAAQPRVVPRLPGSTRRLPGYRQQGQDDLQPRQRIRTYARLDRAGGDLPRVAGAFRGVRAGDPRRRARRGRTSPISPARSPRPCWPATWPSGPRTSRARDRRSNGTR